MNPANSAVQISFALTEDRYLLVQLFVFNFHVFQEKDRVKIPYGCIKWTDEILNLILYFGRKSEHRIARVIGNGLKFFVNNGLLRFTLFHCNGIHGHSESFNQGTPSQSIKENARALYFWRSNNFLMGRLLLKYVSVFLLSYRSLFDIPWNIDGG